MPSLDTSYLGLALRTPIVASAGPLTGDPDTAVRLADAGVGAIVLPSLFEEEIVHEQVRARTTASKPAPSSSPRPPTTSRRLADFPTAPSATSTTSAAHQGRVSVPVIASLNASSPGGGSATPLCSRTPAPTPSS